LYSCKLQDIANYAEGIVHLFCGLSVAEHLSTQIMLILALFIVVGSKKTKKEEIEFFIEKYRDSTFYKDVPVCTMRHIIPLLLMEIYPHHYGRFSRKGEV